MILYFFDTKYKGRPRSNFYFGRPRSNIENELSIICRRIIGLLWFQTRVDLGRIFIFFDLDRPFHLLDLDRLFELADLGRIFDFTNLPGVFDLLDLDRMFDLIDLGLSFDMPDLGLSFDFMNSDLWHSTKMINKLCASLIFYQKQKPPKSTTMPMILSWLIKDISFIMYSAGLISIYIILTRMIYSELMTTDGFILLRIIHIRTQSMEEVLTA
jgi:hypothetical protein